MTEIQARSRRKGSEREAAPLRNPQGPGHRGAGLLLLAAGLIAGALLGVGVKTLADKAEESGKKPQVVLTEEEKMDGIRGSLEAGTSVLTTLRRFYPDYTVMYHDDRYQFLPIDREMELHNYVSDNVRKLDSGEWQYLKKDKVISHKGIDVSSHQSEIDWAKVAEADVEFAMIRALYRGYESGKLVEDKMFRANIEGAQANGIDTGVYVFTQAISREEVEEEFAMLEDLLSTYKLQCPVVVDVEEANGGEGRMDKLDPTERTDLILYYCDLIRKAGYEPMLYYNIEAAMFMVELERLEGISKWFATYNSDFYFPYAYSYWQYSEKGSIPGINGDVDLDIRFGK